MLYQKTICGFTGGKRRDKLDRFVELLDNVYHTDMILYHTAYDRYAGQMKNMILQDGETKIAERANLYTDIVEK